MRNWNGNGLTFDPKRQRWRVCIYFKGKRFHLSYHKTEEAARQTHAKALASREATNDGSTKSLLNTLGINTAPHDNNLERK